MTYARQVAMGLGYHVWSLNFQPLGHRVHFVRLTHRGTTCNSLSTVIVVLQALKNIFHATCLSSAIKELLRRFGLSIALNTPVVLWTINSI